MNSAEKGFFVAFEDGCYVFPEESLKTFILKTMTYGKELPKEADEKWIEHAVQHSMAALKKGCKEARQVAKHQH